MFFMIAVMALYTKYLLNFCFLHFSPTFDGNIYLLQLLFVLLLQREMKAQWEEEKSMMERAKGEAEKKYDELNKQVFFCIVLLNFTFE